MILSQGRLGPKVACPNVGISHVQDKVAGGRVDGDRLGRKINSGEWKHKGSRIEEGPVTQGDGGSGIDVCLGPVCGSGCWCCDWSSSWQWTPSDTGKTCWVL